jgi:chromosome segregation ATPase
MKLRSFLFIALVIIITLVSTGCGVSKSKYDAVTVELNLVKQDKQALQTQLQNAQSQLTDAKTDLVRAQVELESTQGQLDKTQTDLETTQGQLQTTQGQLQSAQDDRQTLQTQLQETQSQLGTTKTDLQDALAQVQSLQNDLTAARDVPAEALSYAEFMDILMYEAWLAAGVTPNYTFATAGEYTTALKNRANSMGDAQLISFVAQIEAGTVNKDTLYVICYYCLDKLEEILK